MPPNRQTQLPFVSAGERDPCTELMAVPSNHCYKPQKGTKNCCEPNIPSFRLKLLHAGIANAEPLRRQIGVTPATHTPNRRTIGWGRVVGGLGRNNSVQPGSSISPGRGLWCYERYLSADPQIKALVLWRLKGVT